jgi:pyruvate dehydrogenase E1 component alpha subunit
VDKIAQIFQKMCLCRYFELNLIKAVEAGRVTYPVYLCLGQEAVAATLAVELAGQPIQIFTQHRAHDVYLSFGGPPEKLRDELLGLPSGTSGGRAGSNCIQYHSDNVSMYGHHGLVGENVSIGVGASMGNRKLTLIIFGDGAAEEDYVLSSLGFAASHKLPVLFICVDNGLAVLTDKSTRRNWDIDQVADAFGMGSCTLRDSPWLMSGAVQFFMEDKGRLPGLLNVEVCRERWHVGTGIDKNKDWDRFLIERDGLLTAQGEIIEQAIKSQMEEIWQR